jgi:hypothetical protein
MFWNEYSWLQGFFCQTHRFWVESISHGFLMMLYVPNNLSFFFLNINMAKLNLVSQLVILTIFTLNQQHLISLILDVLSNLSYVIFQGNSEIWSHKTGGCLIQVWLIWNALWRKSKLRSHNTSYCLIEVVTKTGLIVYTIKIWKLFSYVL